MAHSKLAANKALTKSDLIGMHKTLQREFERRDALAEKGKTELVVETLSTICSIQQQFIQALIMSLPDDFTLEVDQNGKEVTR